MLHEIITHFVKVRNRLQTMSTNTDHRNYWRCYHSNGLLSDTVILIQQDGRKRKGCWWRQEVTLFFWEIKYYFVTMVLNGLMQNKHCKDTPSSQRFGLKLKNKMLSLWAHVAKTSRGGVNATLRSAYFITWLLWSSWWQKRELNLYALTRSADTILHNTQFS